jgi:hypothetical protein
LTFKDLKKRVSLELPQQQFTFFEILRNKPFWIWNVEEHKLDDIRTDGECCFNHIIGLPQKDGNDKPLYDYEQIIFESLVAQNSNKHLWIKKATGLGVRVFAVNITMITKTPYGQGSIGTIRDHPKCIYIFQL